MKYTAPFAGALVLCCLLCACHVQAPEQNPESTMEYESVATQQGTQFDSSWMIGISKSAACQNAAVADWIARCAAPERDDIGHYALHHKTDNGNGSTTHHLLLYRSATEHDAKAFTVEFSLSGDTLTVTPTYTSADTSAYGYDLIYVTFMTEGDPALSVEMLVDGDYPGLIQSTTASSITPDTFGTQADE
ncbi:MAG: hypothetical protein IIU63_05315 [Clostridia bacterium]|nr:hypothetical protein [Clostridia bacterium]